MEHFNSAWDSLYEAIEQIDEMTSEEKNRIGEKALDLIRDYPLYGATSNISYDEAILIAMIIEGDDFVSRFDNES